MPSHRPSRRIPWPLVLGPIVLLVLGAGTFAALRALDAPPGSSPRPTPPSESPARPVPDVAFDVDHVKRVTTVADTRDDEVQRAAADVRSTIERMYAAGFVDPAAWRGGAYPGVLELFAPRAARQARRDLDDLTLGPDFAQVAFVQPGRARMRISFLIGAERVPVAAVAHTRFVADAETVDGGTLHIVHRGEYTMRPVDGQWLVVGYDVRGNLDSEVAPGGEAP